MADRWIGSQDGTSLFACSICGVPSRFPTEMKYTVERRFVCFRHPDTITVLEQQRAQEAAMRRKAAPIAPPFPVGRKASWQT
jgi:hypothetical protein